MLVEGLLEAYCLTEYEKKIDLFQNFGGLGPNPHIWAFVAKSLILSTFCNISTDIYHRMLVEGSLEAYCLTEYDNSRKFQKI